MKNFLVLLFIINLITNLSFANVISGKVDKFDTHYPNKVIDYSNQSPIDNAKISIPSA